MLYSITAHPRRREPLNQITIILEARFLPLAEAIPALEATPWRAMTEPLLALLRSEAAPGEVWCYRRQPDKSDLLIDHLS
jgi:hypothetical protein